MVIAAVILVFLLKIKRISLPLNAGSLGVYFITGVVGNVIPFSLISYGEIHVESGLAALLMGITPVAVVFLAPFVLADEQFTFKSILGCFVGIAGLVLLVGSSALDGIGAHALGQITILGAALCYAITTLYVKRYVTVPPLCVATGSTLVGAVLISLVAFMFESPYTLSPTLSSVFASLYLGFIATALATLIYFYLLPQIGARRMSQINFLVPVLGTFTGVLFMGDIFTSNMILAFIFVLCAIYLVTSGSRVHKKEIPGP